MSKKYRLLSNAQKYTKAKEGDGFRESSFQYEAGTVLPVYSFTEWSQGNGTALIIAETDSQQFFLFKEYAVEEIVEKPTKVETPIATVQENKTIIQRIFTKTNISIAIILFLIYIFLKK